MLVKYTILFAVLLSFSFGIMAIVLVLSSRKSNASSSRKNSSVAKRILPFIEVHESIFLEAEEDVNPESAKELKQKMEGFKTRNQFYRV